jgi:AcrR family transcriptional regulator
MTPRAYSSAIRDAHVEQTRALLMDTARTLLMEGGLEALTLPKLAQAAGVSAPTVYRHFATLDDLFRAFLECLRPELGLTAERFMSTTLEQLPSVPLENFPRYEAHAALLRPLMESSEFNRVRVGSMRDRARNASARMRPQVSGWSDAQLEALVGSVWVLNSPQVWRWLRDTWGIGNDEAAQAASWAMRTLLEALVRGPDTPKPKQKAKPPRAAKSRTNRSSEDRPAKRKQP